MRHRRTWGLTLLEVTVYGSVFLFLVLCTMKALGDARGLRGRARDRAALALYVSTELDRARATSTTLTGVYTLRPPAELGDTSATLVIRRRSPALAEISVAASRAGVYGSNDVSMTTLAPVEGPP